MRYKETVKLLLNIQWKKIKTSAQLTQLMFLSLVTAVEFQESLRIALDLYPENENLKKMAAGELKTNNLVFSDYRYTGDHWEFLRHFLQKAGVVGMTWKDYRLLAFSDEVYISAVRYTDSIHGLSPADRAMSIFSREEELSKIFSNMLEKIPVFKEEHLPHHLQAFKYYLERHVALDSDEGGHQDLVKEFEINDSVNRFYELRLKLYFEAFPILNEAAIA